MSSLSKRSVLVGVVTFLCGTGGVHAQNEPAQLEEVIVTARQREESLMKVPVAVTALSAADISRYNADNLTKIAELAPTVVISNYHGDGGGSLAIRGISTPPTQIGFEQSVSLAIDGVQVSNGMAVHLGFFDVQQVEVMKGPQALFFGKNSPAGVISIKSADPTEHFESSVTGRYEFEGDESVIEGYASGPLTSALGGRIALTYRHLDGWMRNDARPIANPFAPDYPLPGARDHRPGDEELAGRVTLKLEPSDALNATFKLAGNRLRGNPAGTHQNVGPCIDGKPRFNGVIDPYGECKRDNHASIGDVPSEIAATMPGARADGSPYFDTDAGMAALSVSYRMDRLVLSSSTGYIGWNHDYVSGSDQTAFSQLVANQFERFRAFSQELRLLTEFGGPFNVMVGGYYQDTNEKFHSAVKFSDTQYNPVANQFVLYDKFARLDGRAVSMFGQGILTFGDALEITGGVRWTDEKKDMSMRNAYGIGGFATQSFVYPDSIDQTPGVLAGRFKDDDWSPEATIAYHPSSRATIYAAYKTGYKSGGFGVSNPQSVATKLAGVSFGPEDAEGFEIGFKGMLLGNRLRLEATTYYYTFKDLQVTTYNPALLAFTVNNAGEAKQKGVEVQANFVATDKFRLHGAISYNHNRFHDFVGQCYGYAFPTGTTRATAAAPAGCQFMDDTTLALEQDFGGRAPARSPDWSGNAGFEYDIPLGSGRITLNGDTVYSDRYYAGETMSPGAYQSSYWKLNGSIGYTSPDEVWRIALIGRNLTDEYVLLYANDRTGGAGVPGALGEQRGVVGRGREISLQATVNF